MPHGLNPRALKGADGEELEITPDARLIAAAPELLELAERFIEEIEQDDSTIDLHVAFRAAIAKATGGEVAA